MGFGEYLPVAGTWKADTFVYWFTHYAVNKFWPDQEVLYDYNADLHGIGNRSLLGNCNIL